MAEPRRPIRRFAGLALLVLGCGASAPPESVQTPASPFTRLPAGERCVYVRPGAVSPGRRGKLQQLSVANAMAWTEGVAAWAEVRYAQAWRAEAELSVPFERFAEQRGVIRLSQPWDGACTNDCGRPRIWRIDSHRAGAGAHVWRQPGSNRATCRSLQQGLVEQGEHISARGALLENTIRAGEREIVERRQLELEASPDVEMAMGRLPPNVRYETSGGGAWLVRRLTYDDLDLEAQDQRFRREALLQAAQAERPLPVDRVRVTDGAHAFEQLRLWAIEASRRDAAIGPLLELITRLSEAQASNLELLKQAASLALNVEHPESVLPWLDEYLRDAPPEADERVRVLRRWAVRDAAPERLEGLLEAEGVTRRGEAAARMLAAADPYDGAEAAWKADESLREPRRSRARRSGRLPVSTLVETLVGLLDAPGEQMRAVFVRVDTDSPGDSFLAASLLLAARWPRGDGARLLLMSPAFADISEGADLAQSFSGEATISVSFGDETGARGDVLSVQGHVDGEHFVIERESARYDWAAVASFIGEPLRALSRRLFPRPNFRFRAGAEAQALLLERARADEGIACAAGRDGGDVFECAVPAERISARRSMVDLVRPLLR